MSRVEILEVRRHEPPHEELRGCFLDLPKRGQAIGAAVVEVAGWVLPQDGPAVGVELVFEGRVFQRTPMNQVRPDLAKAFPDVAWAQQSGFRVASRPAGMEEQEWEVRGILRDQSRLSLGAIRLQKNWDQGVAPGPLVSVVIPCYRQARFLGEAIESVLGQSYPNLEVVVVDDGSPDNVAAVAGRYSGVRYVRQANGGLSAARNAGFRVSRGDFLVFLDSDDRLLPEAVQVGLDCLSRHPECAIALGYHRNFADNGDPVQTPPQRYFEEDHYLALLRHNICVPAAVFYRRSVLEQVGGFDEAESPAADYDMYLRIAREHPVHCHRTQVAEYRVHGSNMSRNGRLMLRSTVEVLRKQWPYASKTRAMRAAYREGLRLGREHYGRRTVVEVFWDLQDRLWKPAWEGLSTLVRYFREGIMARGGAQKGRPACDPPLGKVNFKKLRTLAPVSRMFGMDRGLPIDRYYIEKFLAERAADIRGHVLEIGDDAYTRKYGGKRVSQRDVLHIKEGNPRATIVADLTAADHLPSETFDCIIFTQTLQYIYDVKTAVRALYRLLTPGGVVLATVPGISQLIEQDWGKGWYWNFTLASAERLFAEAFGAENVKAQTHGNVLTAISFLHGLATEEMQRDELDHRDAEYQLVISLRAVKAGAEPTCASGRAGNAGTTAANGKALILMYHRVSEPACDPWLLSITREHFAQQLEVLKRETRPIALQELRRGLETGRLPDRAVVVTFDDGYADNFLNARPVLEKLGIPATYFVVSGPLGSRREFWWDELERLLLVPGSLPSSLRLSVAGGSRQWDLGAAAEYSEDTFVKQRHWTTWEAPFSTRHSLYLSLYELLNPLTDAERNQVLDELRSWACAGPTGRESHRVMTPDELQTLAKGDLVEVGAHTVTHPCLAAQTPVAQRREIHDSKLRLEELLGREVASFAYPYGRLQDYTAVTVACLKETGYACGCARFAGVVRRGSDAFQLPRMPVVNWDAETFARKLAESFNRI